MLTRALQPYPQLPAEGLLWPNVQTLLPSQGRMGPASVFSEIASPLFAKEPSPGPLHNPGALLVSNIFQNDPGKE